MSETKLHQPNGVRERVKNLWAKPIRVGQALMFAALIVGAFMLNLLAGKQRSLEQAQGADLTAFVQSVKTQLEKVESDRVRNGEPALFKLKDFDLELTVVAKDDTKGTAGVKAEVVTATMEQQLSHEVGQKIMLHMILAPAESIPLQVSKDPISAVGAEPLPTVKLEKTK